MKRIMWALAILIIPAFVIWGSGTSGKKGKKGHDHAGKIFNRKVSFDEYLDMWSVSRDYAIRTFGGNIPPEFIDQLTWNRIILLYEAEKENIAVKNDEVIEKIMSFAIFQRNGSFDKKLYKSMLGENARGFEERIRDDIRISKLKEKITSSISVSDDEVKEGYKKKFEEVKSSYVSIPFVDFEKDVKYVDADLVKFYDNNKGNFRRPEEINVKYIEILFSSFDKEVYITEGQISRYFEEHISLYKKSDSEEIPILDETIKKDISEKLSIERKIALAEELSYRVLEQVLNKKEMDENARSFALQTKETGFFNMQQEVPGIGWSYEFTKRGFELKPGEISNVLVKTDKGFYVMQVKKKKASYMPEFKDAKDSVVESFIKNESVRLAEKKAKKVYTTMGQGLKNGTSFEDIAKEIGLKSEEAPFITRDGYIPALGPARDFVETSVSLKNNEIGRPLKMMESWVILKLDEYQGIDESKFIEEKGNFKEGLLSRKKEDAFEKWFEGLKKEANFVSYTLE